MRRRGRTKLTAGCVAFATTKFMSTSSQLNSSSTVCCCASAAEYSGKNLAASMNAEPVRIKLY